MKATVSGAAAVMTLRTLQHERAEQRFAANLATEAATRAAWMDAEAAITEQYEAAGAIEADDGMVEAFARWLPVGRERAAAAASLHAAAAAETSLARVALTAAAIALEASGRYVAVAAADKLAARRRAEQAALDEQAGLRHHRP